MEGAAIKRLKHNHYWGALFCCEYELKYYIELDSTNKGIYKMLYVMFAHTYLRKKVSYILT